MRAKLDRLLGDAPLVGLALLLTICGVAMIYSAGVLYVPSPIVQGAWVRQMIWWLVASVGFLMALRISSGWLEWLAVPAYIVAIVFLGAALAVGTGSGPAEGVGRWLQIGPLRFQPSELAKIATILGLAWYLANRPEPPQRLKDLIIPGMIVAVPLGLVMLQPDLGTALSFLGVLFAMLFWAGAPVALLFLVASPGFALILSVDARVWSVYIVLLGLGLYLLRYRLFFGEGLVIVLGNIVAGVLALPAWNALATYQKNRLLVFLDPNLDPQGAGWNLIQSKVAIGSGGIFGKGFTQGTQKRLDFLPEQHTDFIFSVLGEELGFVGVVSALVLFGLFLRRVVRLAAETEDPFAGLVRLGIFGLLLVHIFVNTGMTIGVVPITGIPLPFMSYGGTFLVTCWVLVGLAARPRSEM
jgi:rod shape determining protein RodA